MKQYTIYSIKSECNPDDIYIGSTSLDHNLRFKHHMISYYNWLDNDGPYCSSYEVLINEDAKVHIIIQANCNRAMARELEQYYIDKHSVVNKNRSFRTEEYKKNYNKELSKRTYEQKKDFVTRIITCECGNTYQRHSKTQHERSKYHLTHIINNNEVDEFINVYSN